MRVTSADQACRRGGRPRLDPSSERSGFTHGWMVAVDGTSNRILGLKVMKRLENNAVAIDLLLTKKYPKLKTVVYDRACSLVKQAKRTPGLKGIKKYVIDKFHPHRHSKKCVASPIVHRNLARA